MCASGSAVSRDSHRGRWPHQMNDLGWVVLSAEGDAWENDTTFQASLEASTLLRFPLQLMVSAPAPFGGRYVREVADMPNGMPLWKKMGFKFWVFGSTDGRWCVGDEEEQEVGFMTNSGSIVSKLTHGGRMPARLNEGGWLYLTEDQEWVDNVVIKIVAEECPGALQVECPDGSFPHIGQYLLLKGIGLRSGLPVWKLQGGSSWLFASTDGRWFFGDDAERDEDFISDTGNASSKMEHAGAWPHLVSQSGWWRLDDEAWVDAPQLTVKLAGPG
eukprot:TRINITY_DN27443_c0_g1_i1.p1 TRINITY_DN27443_c0_g1~~TRINITY_DN27443_c0_g1_i1.p1  ORF type:complete len:273 (+),score=40.99 TRINITY_DN27443_c0_g1_i1:423-1241(+)